MFDNDDTQTDKLFIVLMNDEEQYSLWPKGKTIPAGWRFVGKEGNQEECSRYVDEVWTDMRPLSLRKKMEQASRS
jgi:MbtH protein